VRRLEGGPGRAAQEEDGGAGDQDETHHHKGRTLEKGINPRPPLIWEVARSA
jgi:hypothetical protein